MIQAHFLVDTISPSFETAATRDSSAGSICADTEVRNIPIAVKEEQGDTRRDGAIRHLEVEMEGGDAFCRECAMRKQCRDRVGSLKAQASTYLQLKFPVQ